MSLKKLPVQYIVKHNTVTRLAALSGWVAERKQKQHRPYSCEHWCHLSFHRVIVRPGKFHRLNARFSSLYFLMQLCWFPPLPCKNKQKTNKQNLLTKTNKLKKSSKQLQPPSHIHRKPQTTLSVYSWFFWSATPGYGLGKKPPR